MVRFERAVRVAAIELFETWNAGAVEMHQAARNPEPDGLPCSPSSGWSRSSKRGASYRKLTVRNGKRTRCESSLTSQRAVGTRSSTPSHSMDTRLMRTCRASSARQPNCSRVLCQGTAVRRRRGRRRRNAARMRVALRVGKHVARLYLEVPCTTCTALTAPGCRATGAQSGPTLPSSAHACSPS